MTAHYFAKLMIGFNFRIPRMAITTLTFFLVLCIICKPTQGRIIIDLTHTLDENAPKIPMNETLFPNFTHYKLEDLAAGHAYWLFRGMW